MTTNLLALLSYVPADEPANVPKLNDSPYFWMPVRASTSADAVDGLFDYIMWVNVISVLALMALMIYFLTKFRAKSRHDQPQASTDHHTGLELVWSIAPLPVVLAMFA